MSANAPQPSCRRKVSLSSRLRMREYMMKAELRYNVRSQMRLDTQNTPGHKIILINCLGLTQSYLA